MVTDIPRNIHKFKTVLDGLPASSGPDMVTSQRESPIESRCPGYNRTEIILTPNITCSFIFNYTVAESLISISGTGGKLLGVI